MKYWMIASLPELASLPPAARAELLQSVGAGRATFWMLARSLAAGIVAGMIVYWLLYNREKVLPQNPAILIGIAAALVVTALTYQFFLSRIRAALREHLQDHP